MKKTKKVVSVLLTLILAACLAGCSSNHDKNSLKDNIIDGWNNWMQSFSRHALTKEKDLQRENGNYLQVTYKLTVEEGTAKLNWIAGNDTYTIADGSSEDTGKYTISAGDNYLVLKGENFSGNLEVTVEDAE